MRSLSARGFTLIEVLVALVIVAVGMSAVMGALTSSANTMNFLKDETFAQWVALNKIATVRTSGQQPASGNTDGDIDFGGRSWHWRQEVVTTDLPGVLRIDVKVRPKEVKADNDSGWTTTVSGIYGNAVGVGNGTLPTWGQQSPLNAPPGTGANGTASGGKPVIGSNGAQGSGGIMGTPVTPAPTDPGLGSPGDGQPDPNNPQQPP